MASFGFFATIGVPTLGVGLSQSWLVFPMLLLASFACQSRRRDARCQFSSFVSNVIRRLFFAKYFIFAAS
jgi:hypothetical protein